MTSSLSLATQNYCLAAAISKSSLLLQDYHNYIRLEHENNLVEIIIPGIEQAKNYLLEVLDPNIENKWSITTQPKQRKRSKINDDNNSEDL